MQLLLSIAPYTVVDTHLKCSQAYVCIQTVGSILPFLPSLVLCCSESWTAWAKQTGHEGLFNWAIWPGFYIFMPLHAKFLNGPGRYLKLLVIVSTIGRQLSGTFQEINSCLSPIRYQTAPQTLAMFSTVWICAPFSGCRICLHQTLQLCPGYLPCLGVAAL